MRKQTWKMADGSIIVKMGENMVMTSGGKMFYMPIDKWSRCHVEPNWIPTTPEFVAKLIKD